MAAGTAYITTAGNGNVQYYVRDGETVLYYSNVGDTKEEIVHEFKEIEYVDKFGSKELGIKGRQDARVRTNIMLTLPNDMDNEKCLQHIKNVIDKTPIKDCKYIISIHKGEKGEVKQNKHVHIIYNERNTATNKKDRRFKDKDFFKKMLVEYKNQFGFEHVKEQEYKRDRIKFEQWKADPDMARKIVKEAKIQPSHQDEIIKPAGAAHQDEIKQEVKEPANPAAETEVKDFDFQKTMDKIEREKGKKYEAPIKEIPDKEALRLKYTIIAYNNKIEEKTKGICTEDFCKDLKIAPWKAFTMDKAQELKTNLDKKNVEDLSALRNRKKPTFYIIPRVKLKWDTKITQEEINIKKLFNHRFNLIDIIINLLFSQKDCEDLKKHFGNGINPQIRNNFNSFHPVEALNVLKDIAEDPNYNKHTSDEVRLLVDFLEVKTKKSIYSLMPDIIIPTKLGIIPKITEQEEQSYGPRM